MDSVIIPRFTDSRSFEHLETLLLIWKNGYMAMVRIIDVDNGNVLSVLQHQILHNVRSR